MDQRGTSRLPRLAFDGDETKYKLWEIEMLGHFHLLGLKDTVLGERTTEEQRASDNKRNADTYVELIQQLDDKSLSWIIKDVPDN